MLCNYSEFFFLSKELIRSNLFGTIEQSLNSLYRVSLNSLMVCCLINLCLDNDVALNFRLELTPRLCPYLPVSSQDIKECSQTNDLAYHITRLDQF